MIHLGGPLAKIGSSAKFGVVVFKASMLYSLGLGPSDKVGLSAKFGVGVFKASILDLLGGSIGQNRFVCQIWCSSIEGIYSQFTGRSIGQSMFICQVWCSSIQGIYF